VIAAYAQADDRQGVAAALDGRLVLSDNAEFAKIRRESVALNLSTAPTQVGDVEVRYGSGLVRLEFMGADDVSKMLSPVVVVADVAGVVRDRGDSVRRAIASVQAIGRAGDPQDIDAGFAAAEGLHRARHMRRGVLIALAVAVIAVSIVWVVRK
jgi:hypothetical protein